MPVYTHKTKCVSYICTYIYVYGTSVITILEPCVTAGTESITITNVNQSYADAEDEALIPKILFMHDSDTRDADHPGSSRPHPGITTSIFVTAVAFLYIVLCNPRAQQLACPMQLTWLQAPIHTFTLPSQYSPVMFLLLAASCVMTSLSSMF